MPSTKARRRDLIPDHMAGWPNDDLLLDGAARVRVEAEWTGARRVFYWEALCEAFKKYDEEAGVNRKSRQRAGFLAVLVGGIGAALAAVLPVVEALDPAVSRALFVIAAGLSAIGLVWCLVLAVFDPAKDAWLQHRLRTERLRQFYFQFMGSDPALASAAFADDAAYEKWEAKRAAAHTILQTWLARDMGDELTNVLEDVNHRRVWQAAAWETPPPAPPQSPELNAYFQIMRKQRMGIQDRYVTRKLKHGWGSPRTRHNINQFMSYALAILAMSLSLVGASMVLGGLATDSNELRVMVSLIALVGVLSISLKVMAEGQQLKAEVERFQWYQQAIQDLDAEFNNPDPAARIQALRDMEYVAYREMRDFLTVHESARFSFG